MIFNTITFTATCEKCSSTNKFTRLLYAEDDEDEIVNPTFDELLDHVDRGEFAICPMCGTKGQFDISKFDFDDKKIVKDSFNEKLPYSIYVLKSDKSNGEIRIWNEPGYFSIAEVSIAFDSINKFFEEELWSEPLEGEDNGFFDLNVEFYKDPFKTNVVLNCEGYSQDEIIMVVNGFYENIPNDKK